MIRVLLVDDHAVFRSSLRLRLEHEDGIAPVGEAGTAEQAITRARVLKPDVVVIDLLLPRMSGYQAIPEILSASPESRIVVVSSQTGPSPVRQAISAGAHGYVPKRASDTELISCEHCKSPYVVGTGTGRRNTAKYCSRKCKVAAFRARQKKEPRDA